MRPMYIKPENALQRAEELLEVNAPGEAISVLQETLVSRRSRSAPIASLEPLALKFVELVVQESRNRLAREALHSYKNLAQNTSVASVEKVVRRFLECAETKLKEAKEAKDAKEAAEKEAKEADEDLEDLETPDTFDSIFATVIDQLEDAEDDVVATSTNTSTYKSKRRQRDEFTPRLKFLWDAYRTVLDVLRNNGRLELLYQQTVAQAFAFCVRYGRKNEFRRLCDTLRLHLASIPRQTNAHHAINLSDPEVLQRFLDTRFVQLQTATDLELWQEGFKSAEDIYSLLIMAASLIAPNNPANPQLMAGLLPAALFTNKRHGTKMMQMVAQYYEKMTRIFSVSGDGVFLAAAWNKYYGWVLNMKGASALNDDEQRELAAHVVLSALAAPVFKDPVNAEAAQRFNRKHRLAAMLGLALEPERASLLADASSKSVLSRVPQTVLDLYDALEVSFHPLSVAKRVRGLLADLEQQPALAKYVPHLRDVAVAKILQQVATLYSTISFESLIEITSVSAQPMDMFTLEQLILRGNQKGEFQIKINALTRTFDFVTKAATPDLRVLLQLPLFTQAALAEKREVFARARQQMEEEHRAALERQAVLEQKKEALEQIQQRKAKEEALARQKKMQEEREALQRKIAEETKQRELERLKKEQEEIRKAEARKIAEALKVKSGVTIADEDLDAMDTTAIFALQAEQIKKEKEALETKMAQVVKRQDFLERAMRKEEIPLLEKAREEQKVQDRKAFDEARKLAVKEAKERHATAVTIKHRVLRMMGDYQTLRDKLAKEHEEQIAREQEEAERKIEAAKAKRREHVREMLRQKKAAAEEAERRKRELEERAREEAERRAREAEEEEARRQAEEEEEEARREQEHQQDDGKYRPRGWTPPGAAPAAPARGGWAPPGAPAAPARGGWAPPGAAAAPAPSRGGWAPPGRDSPRPMPAAAAAGPARGGWAPPGRDSPRPGFGADRGASPSRPGFGADRGASPARGLPERSGAPEPWRPRREMGGAPPAREGFGGDRSSPAPGPWRPSGAGSPAGGEGLRRSDNAWRPPTRR
ncbi:hypothetical protein AMAG_17877 [Allomyces macrogynus ATCC 38327]|uniref:PCI domain-containing protein n=1 Tax=Allomyces macrogynus (strain ATCC 38327) TaxID=578462 RepID=A0A0L0S191_ALLM3|nr:hypothetical protein AMAG_17877 [Allomyces macrogynus ATCC 38327]|eukprot:KNE56156.1 hypothetical protein AMAG_17877 [Allomyces macrogynus ATCC 38327]